MRWGLPRRRVETFGVMERRQEIKLDKLVLEVQKRLIALRKKRETQQD